MVASGSTSRYAAPLSATAGQLADSIRTLWAERALAWLKSQGGILSLSFLNSFGVGGPGAALTKDMPTEVFNRVGEISFGCYGRDRLGCFNVPGVLAATEPGAAPDRGRITVSRDNKLLQRPRQVSFGG